ncbi:hypothetical protein JOD54_004266 [Actinokineospora baliensis]|uniref:NACHT domain-containing protein n=1 Tax=Actinokineospora baliensis TaxID=547056 RepID=UPI00195AA4F6|nr:NACHT domain-containing protein [Actinokineospora baliensis]MBM7774062.1 hypothetical protein [Actinokineospora baliensis]
MDDPGSSTHNKVVAGNISGNVVQAGTIESVTVVAAARPRDQVDAVLDIVAGLSADLWQRTSHTWEIHPEAPVRVSWSRNDELSVEDERPLLSEPVITRLHEDLFVREGLRLLILVGEAGAGKSSAMHLLYKKALDERADKGDPRAQVPLWLTMSDWDPESLDLAAYAVRELLRLPGLRRRDGLTRRMAELLVRRGRIALFLDGLDEMPPALRAKAAAQVNRATHGGTRVVLSTRPGKRGGNKDIVRFEQPDVVRLNPVDVPTAVEFLLHRQTGQDRPAWRELADYLTANPDSALAKALRTPLTINLVRHAFPHAGSRQEKPLDLVRDDLDTPAKITTRLMGLFLDRAYSTEGITGRFRRARKTARYARERATLTWLARRLGAKRDIAWWRIPHEVEVESLRLKSALLVTVPVLAVMLVGSAEFGWPEPWGLVAVPVGVAYLVTDRIVPRAVHRAPATLVWAGPSPADLLHTTGVWLLGGLLFGTAAVVSSGNWWAMAGIAGMFVVMGLLGAGYGQGVSGGLLGSATRDLTDSPSVTPHNAFRADRRRTLVAAAVGAVAAGAMCAPLGLFDDSVASGLVWGVSMGFTGGWVSGLGPAWLLVVARPSFGGPARPYRFTPTLRSALDKQVLRQAGLVYQFRHAELQVYLQHSG